MSPEVLNLILKALDAHGEAVFDREDIATWPEGDVDEALRTGLLEEAAPAMEVVCPGCEEACLEDVEFIYGDRPEDARAYVACGQRDDIGRVRIPLEMLDRWAVNRRQAEKLRPPEQAATKELPWSDDAPEYLPNAEAIKLADDSALTIKSLGRLLTPTGRIRYMRKGRRCKVHLQDFRDHLKTEGRGITDAAIEAYLADVDKRKKEAAQSKSVSLQAGAPSKSKKGVGKDTAPKKRSATQKKEIDERLRNEWRVDGKS